MKSIQNTLLKIGTIIDDKWVILEFIAKGGMGEVYRAHQKNLNRDVAIKVISKQLLESFEDDNEEIVSALQRFQREVQAMAGINHPNVMQIFDYGFESIKSGTNDNEINYIAMEYIPGDTLRETMSEQGFDPDEDLLREWIEQYFLPVLNGVEAIHKKEMVHRDLKPENVLIDGTIPKITDFGLSKSTRWKAVTQSVDIKGTITYMPPEQLIDLRRTDRRADVYSLGKILYEAIAGKIGTNDKLTHLKCVGLENPETPFFRKMDQIIRKATAEKKEDRFQSIEEFRTDILKALTLSEPSTGKTGIWAFHANPKWIWAGITMAIISVLLMTLWHLMGNPGQHTKQTNPDVALNINRPDIPDLSDRPNLQTDLEKPVTTEDNAILRLVSGGILNLSEDRSVTVNSFYMDETPVTNLQYVSFLNQVRSGITVQNNVVMEDENIWLMMGDVTEGYDPIIYTGKEFAVKHPGHASCPVLRVTPLGASAYARFYGKRLPSDIEWIYAYQGGNEYPDTQQTCEQKPIPTPVILLDANILGIRGLNQCIDEWVIQSEEVPDKNNSHPNEKTYAIIGNIWNSEIQIPRYSIVERQPWESFEQVGFRCVMDISGIHSGQPESGERGSVDTSGNVSYPPEGK